MVEPPAVIAQTASVTTPGAITVLRAARWLDVPPGSVVGDATTSCRRGASARSAAPAPAGAQVIDSGDVTLAPGLIDLHTHLTFDSDPRWVDREVTETAADDARRGARKAGLTAAAGFTTVRDVGSRDFTDLALGRAIEADFIPARTSSRPATRWASPGATATRPASRLASASETGARASPTDRTR